MLSYSNLDDRFLTQIFYQNVFQRFCQSCDRSTQILLNRCTFGIAPNDNNINTFFIVASEPRIAEALIPQINNLIHQVIRIMAGVEQIAICFIPVNIKPGSHPSKSDYMLGRFFSLK